MKKHERRFASLAKKWRHRLHLNDWTIEVDYEDMPDLDEETAEFNASSKVTMLNRYKAAKFTVFDEWAGSTPEIQDRVALHEVSHLLLAPIASYVGRLIDELKPANQDMALGFWSEVHEEVTTKLENVFWEAFEGGNKKK